MEFNPYAASAVASLTPEEEQVQRGLRRLRAPTFPLIFLAGLWTVMLGVLAPLAFFNYLLFDGLPSRPTSSRGMLLAYAGLNAVGSIALAILTCFYWQLRRGRWRRRGIFACVIGLSPQPMFLISAPFALWTLLALRHPDVKAAFAANHKIPSDPSPG